MTLKELVEAKEAERKAAQSPVVSSLPLQGASQFAGSDEWAARKAQAMREAQEANKNGEAWIVRQH